MSENFIKETTQGTALILEMTDPAVKNALSRDMLSDLTEAVANPGVDILSIVITGGLECFSAGGDFRELKGTSQDLDYDDAVAKMVAAILASDRIVVAAIEGPCIGAGADIALACDYRVAGVGGFIQIPAVRLGLLYNPLAIERIRRSYPVDTVKRLLLAGERFIDHEACRAGLFSRIVPMGESVSMVIKDLQKLDRQQADAVRATKQLLSDLEAGKADMDNWQKHRIKLLDSEERHSAIKQAHARFVNKSGAL